MERILAAALARLARLADALDGLRLFAEADRIDGILRLAAEEEPEPDPGPDPKPAETERLAKSLERDKWSRELDDRGKVAIPSFADIPAMQAAMLPHLRHELDERKAVDNEQAARTHPSGRTELRAFNRIPWRLVEKLNEPGFWVHSLPSVPDGNLAAEVERFKRHLQGEVGVSRLRDQWYHPMTGGTVAFILYGTPRYVFKRDVGSEWDRWTGRRYISNNTTWPDRTEAWLTPARAKFVGVVTDVAKYIDQAAKLGVLVSTRPADYSSNPKITVPDKLEGMAIPWPDEPPKGHLYWLSPVAPYAQGNRRGFVTPKLAAWLERHKATLPGFNELGHKGAGFMVLTDHHIELPPFDKEFRKFKLDRISAPALRTEELPSALRRGGGRGASAIRFSIIQSGNPFQINDRTGTYRTTEQGAQRLSALLQANPQPLSKRSPS